MENILTPCESTGDRGVKQCLDAFTEQLPHKGRSWKLIFCMTSHLPQGAPLEIRFQQKVSIVEILLTLPPA